MSQRRLGWSPDGSLLARLHIIPVVIAWNPSCPQAVPSRSTWRGRFCGEAIGHRWPVISMCAVRDPGLWVLQPKTHPPPKSIDQGLSYTEHYLKKLSGKEKKGALSLFSSY